MMMLRTKQAIFSLIALVSAQDSIDNVIRFGSNSVEVQRMQKMLDGLLEIKEREISGPNSSGERNFVSFLFDVNTLDGYGCWCRLEEGTHGTGKGFPVDKYDKACRTLHYGTTCLMMDHGDSCSPWTTTYRFNVGLDSVDCVLPNNGDQCKIDLCTIEAEFVLGILTEITSFTAETLNHARYNPNSPTYTTDWSYAECMTPPESPDDNDGNGGNGNSGNGGRPTAPTTIEVDHFEQQCCGNHPNRYPFKSHLYDINDNLLAERACCDFDNGDVGSLTYDIDNKQCCDGAVIDFGNLC